MPFRRRQARAVTAQSLLDAAYDERLRALERIRTASAGVHASRARLESSRRTWAAAVAKYETEAREALAAGDEDGAREAAARCVPLDADIAAADEQLQRFHESEEGLAAARDVVADQLNALRRRRETTRGLKASHAALEAVRADLEALNQALQPVEQDIERQS
jgi:phage shock protein A